MKKVIHFRESDLLNLIVKNEVTLPSQIKLEPTENFIIDTETQTASAVCVGCLSFNRYIIHIKETQSKLFMPFLFCVFFGVFHNAI